MSDQEILRRAALRFEPELDGFGPLLESIGQAPLVLIGEATHGTHDRNRARDSPKKTDQRK
jgi:erythromycin esterase-like protein